MPELFTIKVKLKTKQRLAKVAGTLQEKAGRIVGMDEAIAHILTKVKA